MDAITIRTVDEPRCRVVYVDGVVDLDSGPHLGRALDPDLEPHLMGIRVDLAGVTFMDSTGVNALLVCRSRLEADRRWLWVSRATERIRVVFDVLGLTGVLHLVDEDVTPLP